MLRVKPSLPALDPVLKTKEQVSGMKLDGLRLENDMKAITAAALVLASTGFAASAETTFLAKVYPKKSCDEMVTALKDFKPFLYRGATSPTIEATPVKCAGPGEEINGEELLLKVSSVGGFSLPGVWFSKPFLNTNSAQALQSCLEFQNSLYMEISIYTPVILNCVPAPWGFEFQMGIHEVSSP
jgi:hypothetical protein